MSSEHTQQHPLSVYLWVWAWLFLFSLGSYLVDISSWPIAVKWTLILLFMVTKAALIIAVFMHMVWERAALSYAILLPPVAVLVFVVIMVFESDYTALTRTTFFVFGG